MTLDGVIEHLMALRKNGVSGDTEVVSESNSPFYGAEDNADGGDLVVILLFEEDA